MALIVTLTAIPPRFPRLGPTLASMLAQRVPADRVLLYLPESYRRFPDWDGTLPEVPAGVEIRRVAEDYGPATKVLPATRDFAGTDTAILFGDDDRIYPPDWSESFLTAAARHPGCAIAQRGLHAHHYGGARSTSPLPRARNRSEARDWRWQLARRFGGGRTPERRLFRTSGYVDMFEGCAGVLVKPEMFDDRAFDIPGPAWAHDDVWLSGCLAARGVPIWLVANRRTPANTEAMAEAPLAGESFDGLRRGDLSREVVRLVQTRLGAWT